MRRLLLLPILLLLALTSFGAAGVVRAAMPPGFVKIPVNGVFDQPTGMTFDANGRMYVWERAGRVWIVENNTKLATPLIDISDEVGFWRDHGLLGFALHPNFLQNGWIYLFYAVDHYHLTHAGSPSYDPNASEPFEPSIARITRYTARASDGFRSVDPGSRRVLLGESANSGCPLLHESHGVGSLVFGSDDTLLATCGEGSSYLGTDVGGDENGAYATQALAEGIITPAENVGAYRAQLPSSLAGKILRLDPNSGDGVPGNPFFEPGAPRSARSRVYALGFRNPFRFTARPNTGSHDPIDANPGALYVANVGFNIWEELEVVKAAAYNSGWPVYEGFDLQGDYSQIRVPNLDAPNPLYNGTSCTLQYFTFNDLIVQETPGPPSWPNPCNPAVQIPSSIPRFMNRRAGLTYGHNPSTGPLLTPTFTDGVPTSIGVGTPGSPVSGPQFGGATVTGPVWYDGTDFPAAYQNSLFFADFTFGKIINVHYDANDKPVSVALFDDDLPTGPVSLATNPITGGLYTVELYVNAVYRIAYQGTANQPPVARATVQPAFGATPLAVQFFGDTSTDPEGQALAYSWTFGDGSAPSTFADPIHFYFGPVGVQTTYTATLTVRDPQNLTSTVQMRVYVNNTPPQVTITSPVSQGLYGMAGPVQYPLTAQINDAESGAGQLTCAWQVSLHHNTHFHPEPVDTNCSTSALVDAVGCDGNAFWYTFALTVTDPTGLATTREVALYPDCASIEPAICGNLDASATRNFTDMARLRSALAHPFTNGLTPGELSRCSVIGGTECDIVDLTVLRRYLLGRAPSPEPVCPAAQQ